MSSHDSTARKRRWDASDASASTETQSAQYVPPPMDASSRKGSATEPLTANVDINHSKNRQTLAKGSTHKRIMEVTGTQVTTRGRFYADPDSATLAEPPLHLHIEAATQEALDMAIAMIENMKNEQALEPSASVDEVSRSFAGTHFGNDSRRSSRLNSGSYGRAQAKIFVEIESERGFNVRAKLIGTGGENMKYIQSTTGARVQVRGHGSGFFEGPSDASQEPMHLLIIADNDAIMDQAHAYCQSLVDTVHAQYNEFKESGGRRSDRHRDYGHGRYNNWQQQYPQSYDNYPQNYPQQGYAETHYPQPASHVGAAAGSGEQSAADAAAYEEYANYCAQYYQYYGTYPDYSAYYAQADPSQYAEQHSATATPAADQPASPGTMPAARDEDGYHNVPPPASYSNGRKRR
ncbi:hypothetical protein LPJ55_001195 [Coemansia sp. RSA 990]|nr:hypothetical protein LPJ68_003857 [Coemansia sp. RSA 1086]KAJ1874850.1 hypothetical protein LPJ55_001195 [Coemansia sp. RSA 990]